MPCYVLEGDHQTSFLAIIIYILVLMFINVCCPSRTSKDRKQDEGAMTGTSEKGELAAMKLEGKGKKSPI